MEPLVIPFRSSLVSHILCDGVLITMSANRAHKISLGPKLATPQLLFYRWNSYKYLSGRYALDDSYYLSRTISRDRLNQKVHVVRFNPYLNKNNLVTFGYFKADVPQRQIGLIRENNSPVFGWTYQMIQ